MLSHVESLVRAGASLLWLHPREKRPIGTGWSKKPVWTAAELQAQLGNGRLIDSNVQPGPIGEANLGIRLGEPSRIGGLYLHVFDVDIRDPALAAEALAAMAAIYPTYEALPTVKSGSGGESRHFYFLTDQPFRSKKLAHAAGFFVDSEGRRHWNWEVELLGGGKQVVLPPSVHESGNRYRWLRELDFDLIEMGLGPVIDSSSVAGWTAEIAAPAASEDDEDDLISLARSLPTDVTDAQIQATLDMLPLSTWCDDRDGWLQVGMALHHQKQGTDEGFDLWSAFSKQSPKFLWRRRSRRPPGTHRSPAPGHRDAQP